MSALVQKLSNDEWAELKDIEREIEIEQRAFVRCGLLLSRVRDKKLYREKYRTFAEYCEKRWGWGKSYAYKMIGGSEAVKTLPAKMSTIVDNPHAAAAVADVPEADRADVVRAAAAKGPVTAKSIEAAAKEQGQDAPPRDRYGHEIPAPIIAEWNRAKEFNANLTQLSRIRCAVEKAIESEDALFSEITNTTTGHLANAYSTLCRVIPHTVCPRCQGRQPEKRCGKKGFCHGRGFISEFQFGVLDKKTKELWSSNGK